MLPFNVVRLGGGPKGDPFYANVVDLLHFTGANGSTTFTDEKGKVWTPTTGVTISTSQFLINPSSGFWDGTTAARLTTPNTTDHDFGSGDWTIEVSVNLSSLTPAFSFWGLVGKRASFASNASWTLALLPNNLGFQFEYSTSGSGTAASYQASFAFTVGVWTSLAVTRVGNVIYMFANGNLLSTNPLAGTPTFFTANIPTTIGVPGTTELAADRTFKGYMDELRITKGVGRYSASYTPSFPFPNT